MNHEFTKRNWLSGTRLVVSKGKGRPEQVNAYLREQIGAWIAAEPGRTAATLAKKVGVTPSQISQLRKHGRGGGYQTEEGMARVLGITVDELRRRAEQAWAERKTSQTPAPTEIVVERPERYQNRATAIEITDDKVDPVAHTRIRSWDLGSDEDPEVGWWVDRILELDRQIRRDALDPTRVAERAAKRERDSADAEARTSPNWDEDD